VPYFQRITVTTENKEKYEKVCDYILQNTGLCVLVQSEIQNSTVKIDTERNVMTINTKKCIYNVSDGEDFKVPEIYENLYDNSVDKLLFYSALYEFCGVFELADLCFEAILVNDEKKGINELIFT
jgi:subtilase family serine protease